MFVRRTVILSVVLGLFTALFLRADDPPAQPSMESLEAIASTLKWQTGTITLKDGLAKITLTDDFRYLDPADSEKVLHDLWGNPPNKHTLGMIFPKDAGPLDRGGWGIAISYEGNGYVKDNDADKINYDDLLKQMKEETHEANEERVKEGYDAMELIGWAAPPRYDKETHKLYWAKEYKVEGATHDTLNYNIRILGRRGVLVLNAIASMREFPAIEKTVPEVLAMVDFQPGNTYADFDPKIDKIAEYGLAALVAGGALGAAAKLGLFGVIAKYFFVIILALKKFIILVVVGVVALVKKLFSSFGGKSSTPEHLLPPKTPTGQYQPPDDLHPPVPPPSRPSPPPPFIPPGPQG
jgi:uncharacterized membrane-anchored protein